MLPARECLTPGGKRIEEVYEPFCNRLGVNQEPDFNIALLCGFGEVCRRYKNVFMIGYYALRMKCSAFKTVSRQPPRVEEYLRKSLPHWPFFGLKSMGKPSNQFRGR